MTVMLLGSPTTTTTTTTAAESKTILKRQVSVGTASATSKRPAPPSADRFEQYRYHRPPTTSSSYVDRLVTDTSSKAMRYYRLWIYTCNAVLLVSVLGFCLAAAWIFILDPKRILVPGLSLTQPSFLYAYLALSFQSGFLQFIGCLGAQRLNERLLNLYWLLILLLLIGDGLLGLLWIYRFEWIVSELRPFLKHKLNSEYGVDAQFTRLWDDVQRELQCCGIDGPHDFDENKTQHWNSQGASEAEGEEEAIHGGSTSSGSRQETILPESCCLEGSHVPSPVIAAALRNLRNFHYILTTSTTSSTPASMPATASVTGPTDLIAHAAGHSHAKGIAGCVTATLRCLGDVQFRHTGCEEKLLAWLRHTADIMFVLGYCVIAFLKLCFLGILRYEIKEMIQKIKILQGELRAGLEVQDGQSSTMKNPIAMMNSSLAVNRHHHHNNGRILQTNDHPPIIHGGRMIRNGEDSLQVTPVHQTGTGCGGGSAASGGHNRHHNTVMSNDVDSDTNSHCALIIPEDNLTPTLTPTPNSREISVTGGTIKTLPANNGNNNYELQEFLLTKHHRTQI